MKKTTINKIILGIIIIGIMFIVLVLTNLRKIDATIIDIQQDIVLFEDVTGNVWAYRDNKNTYEIGQKVVLTLNDKGTDFIEDDDIYGVK